MTAADPRTDTSTDAANHWTTLVRNVNTAGPAVRMFVAYPTTDGTVVDSNYVMKVWFSKSLANNISTADLISRFLIKIASTASGSPTNGVVQGQANYHDQLQRHQRLRRTRLPVAQPLQRQPGFPAHDRRDLHAGGSPTLEAFRLVKAYPVVAIKDNIVNPPEYDCGRPALHHHAARRGQPDGRATFDQHRGADRLDARPACRSPSPAARAPRRSTPAARPSNGTEQGLGLHLVEHRGGQLHFHLHRHHPHRHGHRHRATPRWSSGRSSRPTAGKLDNDDDGIPDDIETTPSRCRRRLPKRGPTIDVHRYIISGKTNPLSPDTDGDGLSDGLELGLTTPMADPGKPPTRTPPPTPTATASRTSSADFDPPIFNTTDNSSAPSGQDYSYYGTWPFNLNNSRTDQIAGTMTDPTKADTDGDGLNDGLEDLTFLPRPISGNRPRRQRPRDLPGRSTTAAWTSFPTALRPRRRPSSRIRRRSTTRRSSTA